MALRNTSMDWKGYHARSRSQTVTTAQDNPSASSSSSPLYPDASSTLPSASSNPKAPEWLSLKDPVRRGPWRGSFSCIILAIAASYLKGRDLVQHGLRPSQPQRNKNANFLLILLKYFVTIFFQLKTCCLNCIYTHHIFYLIGLKYDFWFNPKKIKLNNKILNRSSLFKKNLNSIFNPKTKIRGLKNNFYNPQLTIHPF